MRITYLRSSSFKGWSWCPHKFFISNNLGIHEDSNFKADQGTVFHKVMEILANCKLHTQQTNCKNCSILDDCIGKVNFTRSRIEDRDNKLLFHIFYRVFDYYKNKLKHHTWTDVEKNKIIKWCLDLVNWSGGVYDPRNRDIVEAEKHFNFTLDKDWAYYNYGDIEGYLSLKGTIDLITRVDENTIEVQDYKSGQRKDWDTNKKLDLKYFQTKDPQLQFYYYALSHLFKEDVILTIFWIADGGPFTVHFEKSDLPKIEESIKRQFEEIKECEKPKLISEDHSNFKCNRLCHYYKHNWPHTNIRICDFVKDYIKENGIDQTREDLQEIGHNIDKYNAPG